jgi:hypothetical protein
VGGGVVEMVKEGEYGANSLYNVCKWKMISVGTIPGVGGGRYEGEG